MSPTDLQALTAKVATMPKVRLNLDQLAADADADRVGKLPGFDAPNSISTLRGLYTVLYPQHSGTAHPSFRSIHPVVVDISTAHKRVVLEAPTTDAGRSGWRPFVYATALFIAAEALGWPAADRVHAVIDRHPAS